VTLEAGLVGRDEPTLCAFYADVLGFALVERTTQAQALSERGAQEEPGESGSRDETDEDGEDRHEGKELYAYPKIV
jgi:catechol 2,3-dioxygenase-like lactoylglutathione lyase family enzyme